MVKSTRSNPAGRLLALTAAGLLAATLAGCAGSPEDQAATPGASVPPPAAPIGSQRGNYADQPVGEVRGPVGERCVLSNWDRPLTKDLVLRIQSAACESHDHPGEMVSHEVSRTVIPLSESNLKDADPADQPGN